MTLEKYFEQNIKLSYGKVSQYLIKASTRYYKFQIDKRDGTKRDIYHPAKQLKVYQRIFLKLFFSAIPTHSAVYSYRKGISVKNMVEQHKCGNYLLRLDFENFFPSIKNYNIKELLEKNNDKSIFPFKLSQFDITIILLAVCKNNGLTIGAVTSPQISNVILYSFDRELHEYCTSNDIVYTRYADDLFFSTNLPNKLVKITAKINNIIKKTNLRLKLKTSKTIHSSKKHNRTMTGLIITSDNKISIGLKKKQEIKSRLYNLMKGKNDDDNKSSLGGHLSYIKSVEPVFFDTLQRKYGNDLIKSLMKIS